MRRQGSTTERLPFSNHIALPFGLGAYDLLIAGVTYVRQCLHSHVHDGQPIIKPNRARDLCRCDRDFLNPDFLIVLTLKRHETGEVVRATKKGASNDAL